MANDLTPDAQRARPAADLARRLSDLLLAMHTMLPGLHVCVEFADTSGRVHRVQSAGVRRENKHQLTQIERITGTDGRALGRVFAAPSSCQRRVLKAIACLVRMTIEHNCIESTLSLSEQKYQAFYDDNPSMLFTLDAQGRVLSANRYGAEQLGYRSGELEGRLVLDLFHPDDHRAIVDQLSACLRAPGQLMQWEARKCCRDGSVMWVREAARALHGFDSSVCVYVVCQDISDRINAELQVRRHQAELAHVTRMATMGEMASGLAHEINQPLYAIGNYAEAVLEMAKDSPVPKAMAVSLKRMAEQASRASEIVRRVRHFARKPAADRAPTDVNVVVRNALRLIDADARKESVEISFRLARNLDLIELDGLQIEQILINLVRNAIEAIRTGSGDKVGKIFVTTRALKDGIRVSVRDTGPGVARAEWTRIFDPFVTSKPDGLGMGLSICRTLVEAHQGRLWVESKPGRGAIFHLLLPPGGA